MKNALEKVSLFTLKLDRYISLTALFSLIIFLAQVASPDTGGGTGR
jgi:hypothetical protein